MESYSAVRFPLSWRDDRAFAVLLGAVAAVRLALLLTTQGAIHGDEAIVGIMAKDILDRGAHPIFAYGTHYNGGAAVTAYLAAPLFALFGMSELVLKSIPLCFSLAALSMVYFFVRSMCGPRRAFFAALVYATSIPLMKWNFDARGAYLECQFLMPLAFWLLLNRCLLAPGRRVSLLSFVALGLVCGVGFYLLEIFAAVSVLVLLMMFREDTLFFAKRPFGAWLVGLLIGASPLLYDNLAHGWVNFRHIAEGESVPLLAHVGSAPAALWHSVSADLPRLFAYDTMYGYRYRPGVSSWLEYSIVVFASAFLLWHRRERMQRAKASHPGPPHTPGRSREIETTLLAYLAVYLILISMHPLAGSEARYYLFLEPALSILVGLAVCELLGPSGGRRPLRGLVLCLLALSAANRSIQLAHLAVDRSVYGVRGRSDPRTAQRVMDELSARGISHTIVEDWDLRMRIVFLSHESLIASHFPRGWSRHPTYEAQVARAALIAVVVYENGGIERQLVRYLHGLGLAPEHVVVDGNSIYAPLPSVFGP